MSKILELCTKRNTLWEQTKDFLEKNRGENGLVKAEAVEQYNKMAQEVKDLGAEIERLEQQAQIEAQLCPDFQSCPCRPEERQQEGCQADPHCRICRELLEHDPQPWSLRRGPQCTVCGRGYRGRLYRPG